MNNSELLALFQANEHAVQNALLEHGLTYTNSYERERQEEYSPMLKDAISLSADALSDALDKHLAAGEDTETTLANLGITVFQHCFYVLRRTSFWTFLPELFSPGMWWIGLMVKRSGSEVQTLQMNS